MSEWVCQYLGLKLLKKTEQRITELRKVVASNKNFYLHLIRKTVKLRVTSLMNIKIKCLFPERSHILSRCCDSRFWLGAIMSLCVKVNGCN